MWWVVCSVMVSLRFTQDFYGWVVILKLYVLVGLNEWSIISRIYELNEGDVIHLTIWILSGQWVQPNVLHCINRNWCFLPSYLVIASEWLQRHSPVDILVQCFVVNLDDIGKFDSTLYLFLFHDKAIFYLLNRRWSRGVYPHQFMLLIFKSPFQMIHLPQKNKSLFKQLSLPLLQMLNSIILFGLSQLIWWLNILMLLLP